MPVKGETDHRDYRHLRLDNGLQVLLVSDPEAEKAAAALHVNVGHYQNPAQRQGLAQLLEQSLLTGRQGHEVATYVAGHGGSFTSLTNPRYTSFHFDVDAGELAPTLDRFVQLIINPQLDDSAVAGAREALQTQYEGQRFDDRRRVADVYRDLMHPEHPAARLELGSNATLSDNKERPVRDDVQAFFSSRYSANRMGLVILGRASLDDLQTLVSERFDVVPKGEAQTPKAYPSLFPEGLLPAQVNIVARQDIRRLRLLFPVPSASPHYTQKPMAYIAHMLGHEGEGSLLSLLKNLGWAEDLSAGTRFSNQLDGAFEIVIDLTELGERARDQIVALVFYQLEHLRSDGLDAWRYVELRNMALLDFHYGKKWPSKATVKRLARRLHHYSPEDLLKGDYLYADYDADLIKTFLGHLRSDNVLVTMLSPDVSGEQQSRYLRTSYRLIEMDPAQPEIKSKIRKRLFFPAPNMFIPERVKLKEEPLLPSSSNQVTDRPQRIVNRGRTQVWFQRSHDFSVPKASLKLRLNLPVVAADLEGAARAQLLVDMVRDQLGEYRYPARVAGLEFSLSAHSRGMDIGVYGYSSRQSLLLNKIVASLSNARFNRERFDDVKAERLRRWRNRPQGHAHIALAEQIPRLHLSPYWSRADMSGALENITLEDLHRFADTVLQNAQIDALFYGNLYRQEAVRLAALVEHRLSGDPSRRELMPARVYRFHEDMSPSILHRHLPNHPDHLALLYVQGLEPSLKDAAHMQLLRRMLEPAFVKELGIGQQPGHLVIVKAAPLKTLEGTLFAVQSPSIAETELFTRIQRFLDRYPDQIEAQMTGHQRALMRALREPAMSLEAQADRYWHSILTGDHEFSHRVRLAQAVEEITAESLEHYFGAVMLDPGRRLWLAKSAVEPTEGMEETGSVGGYREELEAILYP